MRREAQLICWAAEAIMSAQSRQQLKVQALLAERAYALRCNSTRSERALWQELRANRLGIAFRRQVPIGGKYIADFLAPSIRLVVEVDGGIHRQRRAADARRDRDLRRLGYGVLRLDAEVVLRKLQLAVEAIRVAVAGAARFPP
jgi:very-short-patch-repair endonuclease